MAHASPPNYVRHSLAISADSPSTPLERNSPVSTASHLRACAGHVAELLIDNHLTEGDTQVLAATKWSLEHASNEFDRIAGNIRQALESLQPGQLHACRHTLRTILTRLEGR